LVIAIGVGREVGKIVARDGGDAFPVSALRQGEDGVGYGEEESIEESQSDKPAAD